MGDRRRSSPTVYGGPDHGGPDHRVWTLWGRHTFGSCFLIAAHGTGFQDNERAEFFRSIGHLVSRLLLSCLDRVKLACLRAALRQHVDLMAEIGGALAVPQYDCFLQRLLFQNRWGRTVG